MESFISDRLAEVGVWPGPRTSDGVPFVRIVASTADVLRLCGNIYDIEQVLHSFWVDLERASDESVRWALYFDVEASSARRRHEAIMVCGSADELRWRVALSGTAEVRDGKVRAR